MLTIRETIPDLDCARICAIQNQFDPEPLVAESYVEKMKVVPHGWHALRLTALVDDDVVGFCYVRRNSGMHHDVFLLTLAVDEAHQGNGYGVALLDAVLARASELGIGKLVPMVRENHARAPEFFNRHGFETKASLRESYLDLARVSVEDFKLPEGYQLVRWSEVEDSVENRTKFAEAFSAMDADEPMTLFLGGFDRTSIERDAFDPDTCESETLYLIEQEGEWVAHHQIKMNEPGNWETTGITFTGTLPEHRGLGLATALKNLGVQEAKSRGAKRILTHNDSSNAAMLAINRKQGYVEEPGWLLMVRDL